jgi:hypothetical protein
MVSKRRIKGTIPQQQWLAYMASILLVSTMLSHRTCYIKQLTCLLWFCSLLPELFKHLFQSWATDVRMFNRDCDHQDLWNEGVSWLFASSSFVSLYTVVSSSLYLVSWIAGEGHSCGNFTVSFYGPATKVAVG